MRKTIIFQRKRRKRRKLRLRKPNPKPARNVKTIASVGAVAAVAVAEDVAVVAMASAPKVTMSFRKPPGKRRKLRTLAPRNRRKKLPPTMAQGRSLAVAVADEAAAERRKLVKQLPR